MKLPVVGITMGDAAGVVPEVVMKALARAGPYSVCRTLVIGDRRPLERAKALLKLDLGIVPVSDPKNAAFKRGTVDLVDLALLSSDIPYGRVSAAAGEAAYRYIERAVQLALEGSSASLWDADLRGANLRGAHLTGAYLAGANLKDADLERARYDKNTQWPDGFTPPPEAIKVEDESYVSEHAP